MDSISILGCGWLGGALGADLVTKGYTVRGSTTQESKFSQLAHAGITPYLIRFEPHIDRESVSDFFTSNVLIITIPPRRKAGLTDLYLQQVDAIATEASSSNVSRVIFVSSTAVYRELNRVVTEEDADHESYLFKAEQRLRSSGGFETTVLRFGGLFGPDRHPGKFLAGKKDVSGGNNPVNVIHRHDCIAIIETIILHNIWGEVFNACSDHHPTRKVFYTDATHELGLEPPQFLPDDQAEFKVVSNEKLKRMLNYRFVY